MIASLYQLTASLREGRTTARSLAEGCLERIEATDDRLGAYRLPLPELCRLGADAADAALACGAEPGALCGIPISVKDIYCLDGFDTFAGSPRAVPAGLLVEGALVRNLRNQLAAFTGKTHTVEFAFGGLGVNSHWGSPVNPWDAASARASGGSSSGAGVSLQQGSALVALGSDTAGSVRIPASMTGTVGLKTSFGRWPVDGVFPLSPTLDTTGILTRSVEDVAFAFAAMDPWVEVSPWDFVDRLRSRVDPPVLGEGEPALWESCSGSVTDPVLRVLNRIEQHGARRRDVPLPEVSEAQELVRIGNVVSAEIAEFLESEMPDWLNTLDPLVGLRIRDGGTISASEWLSRKRRLARISAGAAPRFEACDAVVSPTVTITPPKLADVAELDSYRAANLAALHNTCAGNSLSLCAISMPAGLDDAGMPVGLQLMAPHGEEENLLSVALWIEDRIGKPHELLGTAPGA